MSETDVNVTSIQLILPAGVQGSLSCEILYVITIIYLFLFGMHRNTVFNGWNIWKVIFSIIFFEFL